MARYLKISGPDAPEWVTNPQQQTAARLLAQLEVGSVESRAAARALLNRCVEEPIMMRDTDGGLLCHERSFEPETAGELLRIIDGFETGTLVGSQPVGTSSDSHHGRRSDRVPFKSGESQRQVSIGWGCSLAVDIVQHPDAAGSLLQS
jgi:hypothetical protein